MIQARIHKQYSPGPESAAFSLDITFSAASGVTVLFGPSGSGKTLTLDSIAGFVRPDDGRILLDDHILFDGPAGVHLPPRVRRTGYVFQNYALFPHMTLRQNLEFAVERMPRLERHRRVNEMLERFRLSDVSGRRPHELSGGQKQRCSIARALIGEPRLLLLDEPARGLDAPLRTELYAVLRQVRAEFGTPALLVTHDLSECFELGDDMLILRDGRVIQSGRPRDVLDQPASLEVARLLGCYNLMPVEVQALDPSRNTSRLRYRDFEIPGPYFPRRLLRDRAWLCTKPEALVARPRDGRTGPGQIPVRLQRVIDLPYGKRLEFSDDLAVEFRGLNIDANPPSDWVIEFPTRALRLL